MEINQQELWREDARRRMIEAVAEVIRQGAIAQMWRIILQDDDHKRYWEVLAQQQAEEAEP